jgi:hypothetical protein
MADTDTFGGLGGVPTCGGGDVPMACVLSDAVRELVRDIA